MGIERFKSKVEVLDWLRVQGYKVSKATFYRAVKAGKLIVEADGSVLKTAVDRYIAVARLERPAEATVAAAVQADLKTTEEIRKLRLQNEKLTFEMEKDRGLYELKEDARRRLVECLLAFFGCIRSRFFTDAVDVLHKVGGSAEKANLLRQLLDGILNDALYEAYAEGEIRIVVEDDEGVELAAGD